jgi:uncharacterized SAM-binding protein YcdF (DUF218 family)
MSRLVAVLGYSNGGTALHEICSARLRVAEAVAGADDVVLLSGWARRSTSLSEAELMARAWRGTAAKLIVSGDARTTYGNARAAANACRAVRPAEVVLVTSRWHQRRASALFRAALRGSGARLVVAPTDESRAHVPRVRELMCWSLVPLQVALVRVRGS